MGRRLITPFILNHGARCRRMVYITSRRGIPEKNPSDLGIGYWVGSRAGVEVCGADRNISTLSRFEPSNIRSVAESLYRLPIFRMSGVLLPVPHMRHNVQRDNFVYHYSLFNVDVSTGIILSCGCWIG